MSMTIEMLSMRVDTLEKQIAALLKTDIAKVDVDVEVEVDVDVDKVKKAKKPKKSKDGASSDEEVVEVKKKTKKEKKESSSDDEDKPKTKRGPNGYILFSNANRDEVKEKLFVGDEKPKNTDIMKQLAVLWQNSSAEEKAIWNAKAKETVEVM